MVVGLVAWAIGMKKMEQTCDPLYKTLLGFETRNDTEAAADALNYAMKGLDVYLQGLCEARCELAWWIQMRQYGAEHPSSPEKKGITHNCKGISTCVSGGGGVYTGAAAASLQETKIRSFLDKWSRAPYTAAEMKGYDECGFAEVLAEIVVYYSDLVAEFQQVNDDIEYEMSQRGNLTTLRQEKGISDWHLEIIYSDREDDLVATNPSSDLGQDIASTKNRRPFIWLGVGTLVALGAITVAAKYKKGKANE